MLTRDSPISRHPPLLLETPDGGEEDGAGARSIGVAEAHQLGNDSVVCIILMNIPFSVYAVAERRY
jgi:hypothetical protein